MATLLTENLLTLAQQSLESTLTWSNSTNGTVALDNSFAYDDTHSLLLTTTSSGSAQFTTGTSGNAITSGIQIGKSYTASARVRSSTNARTIRAIANYYNGSTFLSQSNIILGTSTVGSFGLVSASGFVVPASTTKIEVLFVSGGNTASETHRFDQLYFGFINQAPSVNAGIDQSVAANSTVNLSGSATDPEGDSPLTYAWSIDAAYTGPAITIANSDSQNASFTAPPSSVDGYIIPVNLNVTDPSSAMGTDQVVITVAPSTDGLLTGNRLTLAQQSLEGSLKWSDSTNGTVAIDTSFAYDGTHSLKLMSISSGGAQFTTGTGANAISGGLMIGSSYTASARVHSSTSRTIRAIVNYYNGSTFLSQSNVALGNSTTSGFSQLSSNTFTIPSNTTKVEVLFSIGDSTAGETHWFDELYFGYQNQPPIVDAGTNQTVTPEATVVLVGTASDPENDSLTYLWSVDNSYTGPALTLTTPTTLTTSFTAPASVDGYTIPVNLTATDTSNASTTSQVVVTVYPGPWVYKREAGIWIRRKLYRRQSGTWIWP